MHKAAKNTHRCFLMELMIMAQMDAQIQDASVFVKQLHLVMELVVKRITLAYDCTSTIKINDDTLNLFSASIFIALTFVCSNFLDCMGRLQYQIVYMTSINLLINSYES